ncbi:MAG TPA: response regulator [Pseudolabrys sp.]|nr:response regulator [Pseudolabrys sp.]
MNEDVAAGSASSAPGSADWLVGGGEMGARIRAFDWSKTPLGPIGTWSLSLRMMVNFLLANRFPLLLWWGPDYISIYNDAYRPVLGAKHPWGLGRPVRECWSEIWDVLKPLIDTPFNGGSPTWMEDLALEINRHGFVEETHFTVAYSPVPDDSVSGGIGGVLATVHEITEKVIGERRLAALRELGAQTGKAKTSEQACELAAHVLARHPKDIPFALFYLFDQDLGRAQLAGAAGIEIGSAAAPAIIDLASGAGPKTSEWPLAEALDEEAIVTIEDLADRIPNVPGGPFSDPPGTATVVPIKSNVAHQFAGFLVVGVSARLKLDEQYRSFIDLAAAQIATTIANARAYEEERKRAEALAEIDRAKTTFFSNVSHEFRTPLTLMLGPIEDLRHQIETSASPLTSAQSQQIELIHRNSLRLLKLTNTLLDFTRIEAGRVQAAYEPTDLATFTAEVASTFRSAMEKAGLDFIVDCPPGSGPAFVDRDMWEEIVLNLLSNAFKFTFEGSVEITLRNIGSHFELTVRDTGTGVPPHELPKLFDRFHRVENAQARTHEGSGIGLAFVQELARLHGGVVSAESTLGEGSTFKVTVPAGRNHLPPEQIGVTKRRAVTSLGATPFVEEALRWLPHADTQQNVGDLDVTGHVAAASNGARPFVLIADDNADLRDYLRRLLTANYEVETVADGEAALTAISRRIPDLVLADIMMPRLDGLALVTRLRAEPRTAALPIILLSARAGEEAKEEGLAAGATDYLVKPFSARELLAHVRANIKMANIRRDAERALRQRTAQFEILLNQAPIGVYLVDADFRLREVNPVARPVFGDIPDLIGRDFDEVIHVLWEKDYADELVRIFRHTLETGEPYATPERAGYRIDRSVTEYYEWRLDRIVLPDGRFGVVCYFRDIAADVQARRTQKLLTDELNHRVKNTLASVQAIVQQTLRTTKNPDDFASSFAGRIQSMSRVHSLLTAGAWKGADLRDIIRDQLLQGPVDETRLTAWGPSVHLEPQMAQHIALMLHELGTNSGKYGALSAARGWVTIGWTIDGTTLRLKWNERGGPPVSAPVRRGFGTTLIEQSSRAEGGGARMSIEADGIVWDITIPLPSYAASHESPASVVPTEHVSTHDVPAESDGAAAPLTGRRFLVVEDEPLVALDLMDGLEEAGAEIAGHAGTPEEALHFVEDVPLDAALLDGNLRGRPVDDIAAALARRAIPFAFVTGYGEQNLPRAFGGTTFLSKPFSRQQLVETASKLVTRPAEVVRLKN